MTKSFTRKRGLLECPSSSGKLDNGEDDLAEVPLSDWASSNAFPNKKH